MICKKCKHTELIKMGFQNGKQRYCCKKCKSRSIEGDKRTEITPKKASDMNLAVLLYSRAGCSYRFIGQVVGVNASTVMKWIRKMAQKVELPKIEVDSVTEIEIDEMWHFISKKNKKFGLLKQLIEKQNAYLISSVAIAMKKHLENFSED